MRSLLLFAVIGLCLVGYLAWQGKLPGVPGRAGPEKASPENPAIAAAKKTEQLQKCIDACDQSAIVDEEGDKKRRECRQKCGAPLPGAGGSGGSTAGGVASDGLSGGATRANEPVGSITRAPANHRPPPDRREGTADTTPRSRVSVSGRDPLPR